jgi:sulfatase maturation enzyme AslB (radical SAM superfamily)
MSLVRIGYRGVDKGGGISQTEAGFSSGQAGGTSSTYVLYGASLMNIAGLEASSVLDYPKKLCSVFFCQGCNYDCFYCHNRSLIGRSTGILGYQEIQSFLLARKGFIQAVVVSGGEPTLQKDLLSSIGQYQEFLDLQSNWIPMAASPSC